MMRRPDEDTHDEDTHEMMRRPDEPDEDTHEMMRRPDEEDTHEMRDAQMRTPTAR